MECGCRSRLLAPRLFAALALGLLSVRLARFLLRLRVGRFARAGLSRSVGRLRRFRWGLHVLRSSPARRGSGGRRAWALASRLLIARKTIFWAFPRHQEVEAAEVLRERDRLVNDA